MRILLVKLSSIGDVVHALPALEVLRASAPGAELGFAVEAEAAPLLECHPAIDRLHVLDRRALSRARGRSRALSAFGAVARGLARERYDAAIDLQGLLRSALVARLGARRVLGPSSARELAPFLYDDRLDVPGPGEAHAALRYVATVRAAARRLGVEARDGPSPRPRIVLGEDAMARARAALPEDGNPLVVLLPGAGKPANRLPPRLLAGTATELSRLDPRVRLALVGGPDDRGLARAVLDLSGATGARDLTGALDLGASAALLARAAVVVGGDTGPLHAARALGRPVVGVFFAADPSRTGPGGLPGEDASAVVVRGDAPCAPCLARRCLRADRRRICLAPITAERIARATLGAMES